MGITSTRQMRKCTRMGSKSSIREVAKRAGVSLGTVSNVLNRPEIVALETRQRVQQAIDEIGFVRNGSARQLRVGTSQHIGLHVLEEQRTQGVLITPVQNHASYLQRFRQRGIAVVLLDRPSRIKDLCSVA